MLEFIRSIPLTGTAAEWVTWLILITFITVLLLAQPRGKLRHISLVCILLALIIAGSVLATITLFFGVSLDEIDYKLILAGVLLVTALFSTGSATIRKWKKIWTIIPLSLVTVGCLLVGNQAVWAVS